MVGTRTDGADAEPQSSRQTNDNVVATMASSSLSDASVTTPGTENSNAPGTNESVGISNAETPTNIRNSLDYLDTVKRQFADRPDVYESFLGIMTDFRLQRIDTPGVIERVSSLFGDHPGLLEGFNPFLPAGYRIECSINAHGENVITVISPSDSTT